MSVESGVICATDAVVDPLTVVIEALHTLVADVAVAGVSRADDFTVRAEQVWLKLLNESNERNGGGALHVTWLGPPSQGKEDHGAGEDHK